MVYAVIEEAGRLLIRMAGRVQPNEHLWVRRALGHALSEPGLAVLCDLTAVERLEEPEVFLLAMIRREVELRGGRLVLRAPDPAHRDRVERFGLALEAPGADARAPARRAS